MASIGFGGKLEVNDGASDAFQSFETISCSLPKQDQEWVEYTYMNQTGRRRKWLQGLQGPGDFTYEVNYKKADLTRIYALVGVSKTYKITFSDTSTATFDAIGNNPEMEITADGLMKIKCTARLVDDDVTFVAAA